MVAEVSKKANPENHYLLNRNAAALNGLPVDGGKLEVVRVPMPVKIEQANQDTWYSYTSVVFANGTLLVPTYRHTDAAVEKKALELYRRVLPGWKIVSIDATDLADEGGSLHRFALNLYSL